MWFFAKIIDILLSDESSMLFVAVSTNIKLVSISSFILDVIGVDKKILYVTSHFIRSICVSISDNKLVNSLTLFIIIVSPSLENANVPSVSQTDKFIFSSVKINLFPVMLIKNSSDLYNKDL